MLRILEVNETPVLRRMFQLRNGSKLEILLVLEVDVVVADGSWER